MIEMIKQLNDEQKSPVLQTEGAVLVIAGAGSGKTRVLTTRIAHLVNDLNVAPYNILAITFTNKASKEMFERLEAEIDGINDMMVCTIHSMCVRILRAKIALIGYTPSFTIYDDNDKERVIKRILALHEIEDLEIKTVKWHISSAKNDCYSPEEYYILNKTAKDIKSYVKVYSLYEEELKKSNSLDFDDLLVKTFQLLKDFKEVREEYASRFQYVHVDEFQDTNAIQYQLVKMLSYIHQNLFVVGDDDQSIYSWRGAKITNILNFHKDFKNAKVFKLEQNYRSTKRILELANHIIQNNTMRNQKNLWTENREGARINYYVGNDEVAEAMFTAGQIKELVRDYGYKYSDFAVLMRINALSRAYEQEFSKYNIPNKIFGGFRFFERKEIKDLMAYLKSINNPLDNESILRVINYPKRGIGEKAISKMLQYATENGLSIFDSVMDVDFLDLTKGTKDKIKEFGKLITALMVDKEMLQLKELLPAIIEKTSFLNLFAGDTEENLSKKMNINEFQNSIEEFTQINENATLAEYLNSVTLSSDIDSINEEESVTIATVHAVKGLEFKCVFICGVDDSIFPVLRATNSDEEMEEERRLMYVAITRAKERLYITRANSRFVFGQRKYLPPSIFVEELKDKLGIKSKPIGNDYRRGGDELSQVIQSKNNFSYSSSYANSFLSMNKKEAVSQNKNVGKFKVGIVVKHAKFGLGTVIAVKGTSDNTIVDVAFKGLGIKSLSVKFAPLEIV